MLQQLTSQTQGVWHLQRRHDAGGCMLYCMAATSRGLYAGSGWRIRRRSMATVATRSHPRAGAGSSRPSARGGAESYACEYVWFVSGILLWRVRAMRTSCFSFFTAARLPGLPSVTVRPESIAQKSQTTIATALAKAAWWRLNVHVFHICSLRNGSERNVHAWSLEQISRILIQQCDGA